MGDFVFNIAKGRVAEFHRRVNDNDPGDATLQVRLLASSGLEADAVLKDLDSFTAVVAGTTNEATNTGYSFKGLTDADIAAITTNDTLDRNECDVADQTWTSVSNDGTGAIGKLIICYADIGGVTPLTGHDFVVTPNGGNITATIADYFRAT